MHHDQHGLLEPEVTWKPIKFGHDAMSACPKFSKCSAPICPLDPDWHRRSHGTGDAVCFYLSEAVKPDALGRFEHRGLRDLLAGVVRCLPAILSRWGAIRNTVNRARTTGSRLDRVAPGRTA